MASDINENTPLVAHDYDKFSAVGNDNSDANPQHGSSPPQPTSFATEISASYCHACFPPLSRILLLLVGIAIIILVVIEQEQSASDPLSSLSFSPPITKELLSVKAHGKGNNDDDDILNSSLSSFPRMIVFDLDSTLWIPESWELEDCPSVPLVGSIPSFTLLDQNRDQSRFEGEQYQGVVGLMVPPNGPTVHFLDGVLEVLQWLVTAVVATPHHQDIILAVASTSEIPAYSEACLDHLEVYPGFPVGNLFQYREIGRTGNLTRSKLTHFAALHSQSGVPYDEMLFFDDCFWSDNVGEVQTLGVIGVRTPDGLTMDKFREGLKRYRKSKQ